MRAALRLQPIDELVLWELSRLYHQQRTEALRAYITSTEGRDKYERAYRPLLVFYNATEPHRSQTAAHEAAVARIERCDFRFPEYAVWALTRQPDTAKPAA